MNKKDVEVFIIKVLCYKYLSICSDDRTSKMLMYMLDYPFDFPFDKANRWIGFIQGVLWKEGLIDLEEERNFTRPLFRTYYRTFEKRVPITVDIGEDIDK